MNGHYKLEPLFALGQIVATPAPKGPPLAALETAGQAPHEFLVRHVCGEWGDLVEEDIQENERALEQGHRLFSAYNTNDGTRIWVITEFDRSVTTLLLPLEY
ncbi:hypothetical protein LCGC14_1708750 [marine sediment metagenome]|uniref:Plasmid related protein n=1 Tax=marine sediment metagenome TaxID=412755 RepID=A0A0F9I3F4_9ZZZZ